MCVCISAETFVFYDSSTSAQETVLYFSIGQDVISVSQSHQIKRLKS